MKEISKDERRGRSQRRRAHACAAGLLPVVLAGCLLPAAGAEEIGPYVAIGFSVTSYPDATAWVENEIAARVTAASGTPTSANASQDKSGTGAKLFAGYSFSDNAAIEASYMDLGETKLTVATTPVITSSTYTVEGTAVSVALVLSQELTNQFSLFGKMGWYQADTKITTRRATATGIVIERDSASNSGTHLALGMTYAMSDEMKLRVEWESLLKVGDDQKTARGDVEMISVSLLHRFRF